VIPNPEVPVKRFCLSIAAAALIGAGSASALFLASGDSTGRSRTGGASAGSSSGASLSGNRREVSSTDLTATQVYQRDSSGVVSIKAVTADGGDTGTGIVLNENGLILTNNHVISEAQSVTVSPGKSSNLTRNATLVGQDANSDLALIKVDPTGLGLKPLKLVSSSSVHVGDPVYAIGNPYGLDETLTKGIVSALEREISAPDGATIKNALQTDAALNPGNSGGPLLNEQGDVIGVNSQIASDAASVEGSQPGSTGVGFAISSNTVVEVIKLIKSGKDSSEEGRTEDPTTGQSNPYDEESSPYETESRFGSQSPSRSTEAGEESPYGYGSGSEGVDGTESGQVAGAGGQTVVVVP
jgi:putative serine protease PepD